MLNRATRRSELKRFKREVHMRHLETYLLDADLRLDDHPLLAGAIAFWYRNIPTRQPVCCACKTSFVDNAAQAAGFLLCHPPNSKSAGVSAFCDRCWSTLPMIELEMVCTNVLRKVVGPRGRFVTME